VPFGRTRLFARVKGQVVPAWAAEFDATTWAQFFLKFTIGHPAVTVVTPATSNPKNMLDNLGGGMGRLPTAEHRKRMIALIESLPAA
jgi:diketogulonate reductase-like aldo/keto reductase